jgi:septal ring factor EnvC (AmiA/AmiB activator)
MPTQGEIWILILIGLLIANLVLLFYVKLDFDKKLVGLSQEVEYVKESLFLVKQEFDKRMVELLQEINNMKAKDIREVREKIEKLDAEMKQLEQQTKERIDHIAKLLTEPIHDESELKI